METASSCKKELGSETMEIPSELMSMMSGEHGETKQKAARLVVDLASVSGAKEFIKCNNCAWHYLLI